MCINLLDNNGDHPPATGGRKSPLSRKVLYLQSVVDGTIREVTIRNVYATDKIAHGEELIIVSPDKTALLGQRGTITLDPGCREWIVGDTEAVVPQLISENSRSDDIIINTDGSVVRGKNFITKGEWTLFENREPRVQHHIIQYQNGGGGSNGSFPMAGEQHSSTCCNCNGLTETGVLYAEWLASLDQIPIRSISRIFCPGPSGVRVMSRLIGWLLQLLHVVSYFMIKRTWQRLSGIKWTVHRTDSESMFRKINSTEGEQIVWKALSTEGETQMDFQSGWNQYCQHVDSSLATEEGGATRVGISRVQ